MVKKANRGRASAIWTALAAGSLGLLRPLLIQGGRAAWLAPLLCVPLALGVAWLWRRLGDLRDLSRPALALYYLWALILLAGSARGYAQRLVITTRGDSPWLFLATAAALCLWLCRGEGAVAARSGRLLFLGVAVVLGVTVALSLPGLGWENLWPIEGEAVSGLPAAVLLCMSLVGCGIYGLCLPAGEGRRTPWAASICAALACLLLAITGSFGPVLAVGRAEPVLLLLEGVRVPGVFRHGEAALEGGLALADLTLMTVLAYGCKAIWGRVVPAGASWAGLLPAAGAILAAGILPGSWQISLAARWMSAGNLMFGVLIPAAAVLTPKARERGKHRPYFVAKKRP